MVQHRLRDVVECGRDQLLESFECRLGCGDGAEMRRERDGVPAQPVDIDQEREAGIDSGAAMSRLAQHALEGGVGVADAISACRRNCARAASGGAVVASAASVAVR